MSPSIRTDDQKARDILGEWLGRIEITQIGVVRGERELDPRESGDWALRHFETTDEIVLTVRGRIRDATELGEEKA